jgi:UDP-GlcNAc:undecaprenyl-phosphate GlcNAc-1-phosphate transferase
MLLGLLLAYAPISSLASLDPGSLTDYAAGTAINRFGAILPLLLPAAIMLIPYADLLMAVIRRARKGMSPFAPDRKHLHHRMLDIGHSHRTSVLIMYLWAALFAGSVVWLSIAQTPLLVLVIVTVGAMLALLFVSMPRLRPWARAAAQPAGPGAAGEGGAAPAAALPIGAHARRPAARAPARPDPTPRTPARPDPTPAPPAPAHRQPGRPAVPAATSPSGPAESSAWLPAPPPPQAAPHPAARDTAPGAAPATPSQLSPPYPGGLPGSSPPWPPAPPGPPAPSTRPKP